MEWMDCAGSMLPVKFPWVSGAIIEKWYVQLIPKPTLSERIWWLEWPDKLLDPTVFLEGDQYDAIMNYRWYRVARGFSDRPNLSYPSGFVSEIKGLTKE